MPLPPLVDPVAALSHAERARTARHASLLSLGEIGQRRLAAAHVAIVGAGGLGSPVILALAAAGVGTLTIIDDDIVEASNLQRQVIHSLAAVGQRKVDSARAAAAGLSPETVVITYAERLTPANAERMLRGADLVIDGTDTFDTREAVAAATEALGIPLVWGTVQEFDAQVTVFWSAPPAESPAVRLGDLYPAGSVGDVPTCADVGVLGALCLQVGSLLAIEAVKLIAGIGEPLLGRVLVIDGLRARQREVPLRPRQAHAGADAAGASPAEDSPTPVRATPEPARVDAGTLAAAVENGTAPDLIDVREASELDRGAIAGIRHVPLMTLLADPAAAAPPDGARTPSVVICQAGARAQRAARALLAAGVDAVVLAGGMDAWPSSAPTAPSPAPSSTPRSPVADRPATRPSTSIRDTGAERQTVGTSALSGAGTATDAGGRA
ncbi:HesA/MoeB/ThiF family protein [Microbacterium sp. LRZ72]|uniref:HesA/MoeB/ThiF family protein n=1 Tax=Microbacterium sp. LRZ72 TaxID=2942481 RepID=UPI0029A37FE6|nr:HesA/MoeB/ThiF family protein [Microbacterium sp. LRZ72]MDX2376850.1 HesA/MoeB/ThiF family protein [Microbacterium sp. LRZ72]